MIDEQDQYNQFQGVAFGEGLKLQTTIQRQIERCIRVKGNEVRYPIEVEGLRDVLLYDIPGLPFKTRIEEKEQQIEQERRTRLKEFLKAYIPIWQDNSSPVSIYNLPRTKRIPYQIREHVWVHEQLFRFLMSLQAEFEMFMRAKRKLRTGSDNETADNTIVFTDDDDTPSF